MKRRTFIGATLAGGASLLANSRNGFGIPTDSTATQKGLKKFPLGKSGLEVTPLGFGTGMRGYHRRSNQTRLGEANFRNLLRYAYDKGIRYFDLADLYGTHPDPIPALKGIDRSEFVLVSKIWWREGGLPELERLDADVLVERFLGEIQTDYIDLVHLHCVTDADWPHKLAKQMDLLDKLKEQGKIRAHGVSVHALPALEVAAEHPWVDAVHTRINPHGVKMDDTPEKVVPVLQKMHENGKGVTGMKLIGEGEFANDREKRENSVRWVYGLGCVDTGIIGFEKKEEVDEAVALVTEIFAEGSIP
jgi:aryl-alcohol dehydrogenase-like predicted oxidoreductase